MTTEETCPVCRARYRTWLCPNWDEPRVHLKGYPRGQWPREAA